MHLFPRSKPHTLFASALLVGVFISTISKAQDPPPASGIRGSLVEDRAAKKLLEAGDLRMDADEADKALDIYRSVIERYPRSRVRFDAHLKLGNYLLEKNRTYEEARGHFEAAADPSNPDQEKRAEAILKTGVCFFEGRHFGKCFKVMRGVIAEFPTSPQVNTAYYYIGLGHFRMGHYSRAIEALEKVGTALSDDDVRVEKVEAGKRLYIKIDDQDLAILKPGETVTVTCRSRAGDEEMVECSPVGRNVRVVMGSILTELGKPRPNNGKLETRGGDRIDVVYVDEHTKAMTFNEKRLKEVIVVGTAQVAIMDGGYQDKLEGVVIGKQARLQVTDADFDTTDGADTLRAKGEVFREKSDEEIESELAALIARGEITAEELTELNGQIPEDKISRYKEIDSAEVTLTEVWLPKKESSDSAENVGDPIGGQSVVAPSATAPAPGAPTNVLAPDESVVAPPPTTTEKRSAEDFAEEVRTTETTDNSIHSGTFRGSVSVVAAAEPIPGDDRLQVQPGDKVRLTYVDELNITKEPRTIFDDAKAIEGNLGDVRVTKTDISDEELKLKTKLRTAGALTSIGNHYKEFGLAEKSKLRYGEALDVCEEITTDAQKLGGPILEETYVQLWRIYFAMDEFNLAAAMCQRLLKEFPESSFVDEAMVQQAHVARKQGDLARAISLYTSIVRLQNSPLRGEGQFGIAECYEEMALKAPANRSEQMFERAFVEYKKVYEQFPDSGRVGEAVAKMANFYYQKKDYSRAVDVFENVLTDYPDANFLDVILFNYGRCLYRLGRKGEAKNQFDQLLNDFPESTLAPEAKKIVGALSQPTAPSE